MPLRERPRATCVSTWLYYMCAWHSAPAWGRAPAVWHRVSVPTDTTAVQKMCRRKCVGYLIEASIRNKCLRACMVSGHPTRHVTLIVPLIVSHPVKNGDSYPTHKLCSERRRCIRSGSSCSCHFTCVFFIKKYIYL